ncbi:hypothetical protein Cs7R123_79460 [Catellatospora sp. TT07R-123]|nr:hypothetical protein Cs7R123_79460 [Catellatospora sp. TT07R-123]
MLGATSTALSVVGSIVRQMLTPADLLGRVSAVSRLLGLGAAALGALAGGAIAHVGGLSAPSVAAAGILLACAAAFLRRESPACRKWGCTAAVSPTRSHGLGGEPGDGDFRYPDAGGLLAQWQSCGLLMRSIGLPFE